MNDGTTLIGHPWLVLPYQLGEVSAYAVEAEIRVDGLAEGVCDQSFGLVLQPGGGWPAWGGGVLYGCDVAGPRARITEVSDWATGYNLDPELGSVGFDPDTGSHTYRLELRGSDVRLLIDGTLALEQATTQVTGGSVEAAGGEVGLWSQGVRLEVRRVTVLDLER